MNKPISVAIKLIIFAAITAVGIIYVINKSPVEDMGSYEKQEMVKPNRSKSVIDQFFSTDSDDRKNAAEDDAVSLMGTSADMMKYA